MNDVFRLGFWKLWLTAVLFLAVQSLLVVLVLCVFKATATNNDKSKNMPKNISMNLCESKELPKNLKDRVEKPTIFLIIPFHPMGSLWCDPLKKKSPCKAPVSSVLKGQAAGATKGLELADRCGLLKLSGRYGIERRGGVKGCGDYCCCCCCYSMWYLRIYMTQQLILIYLFCIHNLWKRLRGVGL